jgi:hypothetical protein
VDQILTDPQAVLSTSPTPISMHDQLSEVADALVLQLPGDRHPAGAPRPRPDPTRRTAPETVRLLAALTAQELDMTSLARDLGIDDNTVRSYLPLLETVFLLHDSPPGPGA